MDEFKACWLKYSDLSDRDEEVILKHSLFGSVNNELYFMGTNVADYRGLGISKRLVTFLARMHNKGFRYVGFSL